MSETATDRHPWGDLKSGLYIEDHQGSEWVTLSPIEVDAAVWVGSRIWEKSQRDGRHDRLELGRGFKGKEGRRKQCLGSLCERIAAKCLGIYWPGNIDNFGDPDLPHNVEVKLVGAARYGMRVYPRTDDSRRVIGVVVPVGAERSYRYRVAGWYPAGSAKKPDWKIAPYGGPPMFCVPQSELLPVSGLRQLCAAELSEGLT